MTAKRDKKPGLTDLAGTGVLEHNQDTICFIYREEDTPTRKEEAEIIIPRNKLGECGSITLLWKKSLIKFYDKENGDEML